MVENRVADYRQKQLEIFDELERRASQGSFGSFIPITPDFANDDRISLAAIKFLPRDLSDHIEQVLCQPLRAADRRQFFFATESLHMTVQNVRKISDQITFSSADVRSACGAFARVAARFAPFDFSLEGLLVLPASVAIRAIAEPRFAEFSRAIRDELEMSGVPDDKPYINDDIVFGNITFCRFTTTPSDDFLCQLAGLRNLKIGQLRIDSFALMSTNAICDLKKTTLHQAYSLLPTV